MLSYLYILFSLFFTCVVADVFVSNPVDGTIWTIGSNVTVTWKPKTDTNSTQTVDLTLVSGPEYNLSVQKIIANDVATENGSLFWRVPEDILPGTNYSVCIGKSGSWSYSHFFEIRQPGQIETSTSHSTVALTLSSASATSQLAELTPSFTVSYLPVTITLGESPTSTPTPTARYITTVIQIPSLETVKPNNPYLGITKTPYVSSSCSLAYSSWFTTIFVLYYVLY